MIWQTCQLGHEALNSPTTPEADAIINKAYRAGYGI